MSPGKKLSAATIRKYKREITENWWDTAAYFGLDANIQLASKYGVFISVYETSKSIEVLIPTPQVMRGEAKRRWDSVKANAETDPLAAETVAFVVKHLMLGYDRDYL